LHHGPFVLTALVAAVSRSQTPVWAWIGLARQLLNILAYRQTFTEELPPMNSIIYVVGLVVVIVAVLSFLGLH
jgi:hypothetical protein